MYTCTRVCLDIVPFCTSARPVLGSAHLCSGHQFCLAPHSAQHSALRGEPTTTGLALPCSDFLPLISSSPVCSCPSNLQKVTRQSSQMGTWSASFTAGGPEPRAPTQQSRCPGLCQSTKETACPHPTRQWAGGGHGRDSRTQAWAVSSA